MTIIVNKHSSNAFILVTLCKGSKMDDQIPVKNEPVDVIFVKNEPVEPTTEDNDSQRILIETVSSETNNEVFICNICAQSFDSNTALGVHEKSHFHSEIKLENDSNDTVVPNSDKLKTVEYRYDEQLKKYLYHCRYCPLKYARSQSFIQHEKAHREGNAPKNDVLKFDEKTGKYIYHCRYCPKTYTKSSAFLQHEKAHKGINMLETYECNKCSKKYVTNHQLDEHYLTHKKDGYMKCHWCDKEFANKARLKEHEDSHLPKKS